MPVSMCENVIIALRSPAKVPSPRPGFAVPEPHDDLDSCLHACQLTHVVPAQHTARFDRPRQFDEKCQVRDRFVLVEFICQGKVEFLVRPYSQFEPASARRTRRR
ncbi:MAG: hypothetical protein RLZ98_469 [Pseudomonadota bacterium]